MAISVVNSQSASIVSVTSVNVDTSMLSIGDICFVFIAKVSANAAITPPAGWSTLLNNGISTKVSFAKRMAVGGDITTTNTFSFSSTRGVMFSLSFRGASGNDFLTTYQGGLQGASHVSAVDWFPLTNVPAFSIFIGYAATYDSSVNGIGTTAPLPAGYTDSGQGTITYGLGTNINARLFYKLGVSGSVDPPDTTPGGGTAGDYGYDAGSYAFTVNIGAATMDGAGDLFVSGAGVATTSLGTVTMAGVGDIQANAEAPLCQFDYIAYDYAGAFFCLDNFGNFTSPVKTIVVDLCVPQC